jgi:acyl transferase domain-containing protein
MPEPVCPRSECARGDLARSTTRQKRPHRRRHTLAGIDGFFSNALSVALRKDPSGSDIHRSSPGGLRSLITVPDAPLGILGLAVRLPGAPDLGALWSVLEEQRSTVTDRPPPDRWHPERFLNPNPRVRGATYTFAGGYLREAHAFDAQAFGLSPREAAQMDPQQRLMLEVVWEALEDAGIPPSSLAGRAVGVYVGASATDYADVPLLDLGAIEAHFMTGNSLSIISNRVSYVFDLKGPSLTLDTACSSSVVALAEAAMALESGRIELAIVGGVNVLASPAPFIGFSRAGMLSPTGRSRPFSALADGYVRSEGAVALVLGKLSEARRYAQPRALLRAIGVNSDGRTNGINLPSVEGQRSLLAGVYERAGIAPSALDFVEAHGTGTRAGDPVEARAIGTVLGRGRNAPLPIGSVKSNIGHLEAASGLAGLAKCVLALEHRRLPASLYLEQPNPQIPMEELGLAPAAQPVALAPAGRLLAGLCNYGFGGTNAHALLESAPLPEPAPPRGDGRQVLLLSAHTREALQALAGDYAQALREHDPRSLAAEADATRDRLRHRLVLDLGARADAVAELEAFHRTGRAATPLAAIQGEAVAARARVAFVFSGNGSQWPGMGRAAWRANARFRAAFDEIAALVRAEGGVCPLETMEAADCAERLRLTTAAQPLIFTTQMALVAALEAEGLRPDVVLGHSVGEVAAACASGALSLADAVRLIVRRSAQQEFARDLGRMAVLACDGARAAALLAEAGGGAVEVAALNGPASTTISGTEEGVAAVIAAARRERLAAVQLDIEYPFHSALLDPAREPLIAALSGIAPRPAHTPFLSTVTGQAAAGETLDAAYWWSNVRAPVLLQPAVEAALAEAEVVVEIGPRPILGGAIAEVARVANRRAAVLASLTQEATPPRQRPHPAHRAGGACARGRSGPAATPRPQPAPRPAPAAAHALEPRALPHRADARGLWHLRRGEGAGASAAGRAHRAGRGGVAPPAGHRHAALPGRAQGGWRGGVPRHRLHRDHDRRGARGAQHRPAAARDARRAAPARPRARRAARAQRHLARGGAGRAGALAPSLRAGGELRPARPRPRLGGARPPAPRPARTAQPGMGGARGRLRRGGGGAHELFGRLPRRGGLRPRRARDGLRDRAQQPGSRRLHGCLRDRPRLLRRGLPRSDAGDRTRPGPCRGRTSGARGPALALRARAQGAPGGGAADPAHPRRAGVRRGPALGLGLRGGAGRGGGDAPRHLRRLARGGPRGARARGGLGAGAARPRRRAGRAGRRGQRPEGR